jgi:hypothetical protein
MAKFIKFLLPFKQHSDNNTIRVDLLEIALYGAATFIEGKNSSEGVFITLKNGVTVNVKTTVSTLDKIFYGRNELFTE